MVETYQKISAQIDALQDEMVAFQEKIIAIPALGPANGGQGEWAKAKVIRTELEAFADRIEEFPADDPRVPEGTRPNIAAYINGTGQGPRTWILAHMDVVPAGREEEWHTPPFEAAVKEGKIYGRGAEDNHQGLLNALFVGKAFKQAGVMPPGDLGLLFLADEETGNDLGIQHILEHADLFRPDDIILIPDGGEPNGSEILIAEKGILWLKFTVQGKQSHASMPDHGINAHRVGAHLIVALDALHKKFAESNELFDPPYSTFEPTVKFGNEVSYNISPGRDEFGLDCRLLPGTSSESVRQAAREIADQIEQQFKVEIMIETKQDKTPAPATKSDAPVVQRLQRAIKAINGVEPKLVGIGGGTFATYLRHKGFQPVVYAKLDNTLHTPNEYCVIANLVSDTKIMAHVICDA